MLEPALQVLGLVAQGAQNNWFGIGCPAHCRGADLGLLLASFLFGLLTASFAWISLVFYFIYRPSGPTQSNPEDPPEPPLLLRRVSALPSSGYPNPQQDPPASPAVSEGSFEFVSTPCWPTGPRSGHRFARRCLADSATPPLP